MPHTFDLGGDERPWRMRSDDDAGNQQAEDRAEAKMPKHRDGDRRDDQQQHGRVNERFGIHASGERFFNVKVASATHESPLLTCGGAREVHPCVNISTSRARILLSSYPKTMKRSIQGEIHESLTRLSH